jgi:hypothetical protein
MCYYKPQRHSFFFYFWGKIDDCYFFCKISATFFWERASRASAPVEDWYIPTQEKKFLIYVTN